jgi:riboflavin biosynthesis pyrimidine reductase
LRRPVNIVARHAPPSLRSIHTVDTGTLASPPNHSAKRSGSVHSLHTRSRGTSKTRVMMPKYVVSSTLQDPEWDNTTALTGDVVGEAAKLRQELDGDIVVHGSARLVQTLLDHNLVDELRLMVFPVVLGSGRRLFGDTSAKKPLRLADSRTVGDGIAILIYQPAGEEAKASSPN